MQIDLNTVLTIATLAAVLVGLLAGIKSVGKREQKHDDLEQSMGEAEAHIEAVTTRVTNSEKLFAVLEARHHALCERVDALESGQNACRAPENDL